MCEYVEIRIAYEKTVIKFHLVRESNLTKECVSDRSFKIY